MDDGRELKRDHPATGLTPAEEEHKSAVGFGRELGTVGGESKWAGLRGLIVAQVFGQFNDQAWKQLVILLAMAPVVGEAAKQEQTALVSMFLLAPLTLVSLPAGVL